MPRRTQSSQRDVSASQQSSQLTLEDFSQEVNIEDQVNNCVRYIIQRAGHKPLFRKTDLQKNVISSSSRNFEAVIQRTTQILRDVYGFNLILCDATNSNKTYILSNSLPMISDDTENKEEVPEDVHKILLMLILSHIFMTTTAVGEASMNSFLNSLKIDMERRHPLFGNVKDFMSNLIKQKYLHAETDPVSRKNSYTWGIRAEKEISKNAILQFVCKMYSDSSPTAWTNQHQIASEQGFENYPQENDLVNANGRESENEE